MSEYIPPTQPLLASASPTTRGTARRMKIYFQPSPNPNDPNIAGANENDPPVAPAIDSDIDIAISNKKRYIQYAVDRSTNATANNPTPLSSEVGTTAQKTYINQDPELNYSGIPNAFNMFNDSPTMFDNETLTRDAGVKQIDIINTEVGRIKGHYAGNVGRPFAIRKYIGQLNALETSNPDSDDQKNAHHNKLVDAKLLSFRGANSQKKRVPPAGGDPETRDNPITLGNMFYQGGLGKFAVGTYVRQDTSKATPLTIEQLKQVGLNIVFHAVGGDDLNGGASIKTPADAALAELALAIPLGPRIGQKVKLSRFSAAEEARRLFGAKKETSTTFIDTDGLVESYGSFNNPLSQFDAPAGVGQIAVCVAMVLVLVGTLSGIVGFVSLKGDKAIRQFHPYQRPNDLVKGSSTLHTSPTETETKKIYPSKASSNLGDFLSEMLRLDIFNKPKYQFDDCLSEGIKEFFGFSPSGGSFATTSMKIMTESGRLNVILRELIRNGVDLGESAEAAFTGTGVASPITGVLSFFKSLTNLKIIKFINVLVNIGDKVLEGNIINELDVDSLSGYDNENLIKKSRLSNGTLAWSTKTALYYPITFERDKIAALETALHLRPEYSTGIPTSRLTLEVVEAIEADLNADYMPFYFHDLRTNEIMSFHAFLENASEDFSVEYTSQEGYGRMDKVQIYKGTTRNITVDFKMIATNADSHDDMWYKINRLAMMIYPQWTQGRKLDVGNLKFIQPFSQIPGATPVVRLRLGDLYKSNYSKMAVARLFGATTRPDYSVDDTAAVAAEAATAAATARTNAAAEAAAATAATAAALPIRINNLRQVQYNGLFTSGANTPASRRHKVKINPNTIFIGNSTSPVENCSQMVLDGYNPILSRLIRHGYFVGTYTPGDASNARTFAQAVLFEGGPVIAFYRGLGETEGTVKIEITSFGEKRRHLINFASPDLVMPPPPSQVWLPLRKSSTDTIALQTETISLSTLHRIIDFDYTCRFLQEQPPTIDPPPDSVPPPTPATMTTDDFYDDTKNPILKAFNSTAGKGLAGVITSFKVDYKESDKRWGIDAEKKLRAPMYVTISVTMAVIHDIPLGLDANGIMNAPIWPIGNSSNYFMRGERTRPTSPGPNTVDPREIG